MKTCIKCGVSKPRDEFRSAPRNSDGKSGTCKVCRRAYEKQHYVANRKRIIERKTNQGREFRAWVRSLKEGKPCKDCGGVFHFSAMHWHHRDFLEKEHGVSALAIRNNKNLVLSEIAKCDLLCANCHSVRTFDERESGKYGRNPPKYPRGGE